MKNLPLNNYAFRELELDYKEWLAILGYAEQSVYNLPHHAREFLHWLEENKITKVEEISAQHVYDFLYQVSERPNMRRAGNLSNNYKNKFIQALNLLSQFARQTSRGSFTVQAEQLPIQREAPDILTPAEVHELYKACDHSVIGLRDKAMLALFYGCGLRRNEGIQTDINDIDFKSQLLYVRKGKGYKERFVPMNEKITQYLRDYLDHSRPMLQTRHKTNALLLSKRGERIQGQSLMVRLRELKQNARIDKHIGLHMLRHSIATHLLQQGMKLEYIARFLGHSSLESTQIYTHVSAKV